MVMPKFHSIYQQFLLWVKKKLFIKATAHLFFRIPILLLYRINANLSKFNANAETLQKVNSF